MNDEHELLTLAVATRRIQFNSTDKKGRALRDELLAREKMLKVRIMSRRRHRKRTVLRVTLASIRKHCPDLMPSKADELLREARQYLSDIDRRIEDSVANHVTDRCEPRFRRLEADRDKLAETVRDISAKVKQLSCAPGKRLMVQSSAK